MPLNVTWFFPLAYYNILSKCGLVFLFPFHVLVVFLCYVHLVFGYCVSPEFLFWFSLFGVCMPCHLDRHLSLLILEFFFCDSCKKYLLCIWSELLLLLYLLLMFWTFKCIPDFLDVLYWIFVYLNFTFLWQSCSFFYVIKTWHSLFQSFNMLMRFLLTSRGFFVLTFILVYLFFSVSSSLLNSICLALIIFLISFNCLSYYDLHWGNYL